MEEAREGIWDEFETWERSRRREVESEIDDLRDVVEDQADELQDQVQDEMRAARRALEDQMMALEDQRDQFEDAFEEELETKREELDELIETLREESMQPLEEKSLALDEEIEERWAALEVLYQEQQVLTDQMKVLEVTIRDLDRQAEFGVLNVLTGALENAAELEKKGGVGSFDSFIPGVDFGPDLGDLSPNGTAPAP